jgi:hypothetical protein
MAGVIGRNIVDLVRGRSTVDRGSASSARGDDHHAGEQMIGVHYDAFRHVTIAFVLRRRSGTRIDGSRTNGPQGIRAGQHIENGAEQLPIKNKKKSKVHTLCTFGADARHGGSPYLIPSKQDSRTNTVYT